MKVAKVLITVSTLIFVILAVGLGYWWFFMGGESQPGERPLPEEQVEIYFYNKSTYNLELIERQVKEARSKSSRIRQITEELSTPPDESDIVSLMPNDLKLRSAYIDGQTVYLDFNDQLIGAAEGSSGEMMFLYSIVNSVLANLPDRYKLVQFLVEGEQRKTIGPYGEESGHIAIQYPLGPRWNLADSS